jgi:hypothetical protein
MENFKKFDTGKTQWSILPWPTLEGLVKVLEYGAKKYGNDNWRKCTEMNRYFDAMIRHYLAYQAGELLDKESGLPHLHHMATNALFIAAVAENLKKK